jgi:hypothetical protein
MRVALMLPVTTANNIWASFFSFGFFGYFSMVKMKMK